MDLKSQIIKCITLLSEYERTGIINLKNTNFLCPGFLLPVALSAIKLNDYNKIVYPENNKAKEYFERIMDNFNSSVIINDTLQPIVSLPKKHDAHEIDKLQETIGSLFDNKLKSPIYYLLGEIITNIYEHANHKNAFIMAQKYPKKNEVDLCIMDDGITIPTSYKNFGFNISEETEAIRMALQGFSTKEEEGRGNGLRKTASMLLEAFNAEYLLFSGNAGVFIASGNKTFLSSKSYRLNGTLVACKLSYAQTEQDISKYYDP